MAACFFLRADGSRDLVSVMCQRSPVDMHVTDSLASCWREVASCDDGGMVVVKAGCWGVGDPGLINVELGYVIRQQIV